MKEIKLKGWFAKNISRGGVADALFFYSKPKKHDGRYRHNRGYRYTTSLRGYKAVQTVVEEGECKKVEIIIREAK